MYTYFYPVFMSTVYIQSLCVYIFYLYFHTDIISGLTSKIYKKGHSQTTDGGKARDTQQQSATPTVF